MDGRVTYADLGRGEEVVFYKRIASYDRMQGYLSTDDSNRTGIPTFLSKANGVSDFVTGGNNH